MNSEKWNSLERLGALTSITSALNAKHKAIDDEVANLINPVRSKRFSVTISHVQICAG